MNKKKKKIKVPTHVVNDVNDREPASQATLNAVYGKTSYGYTGKLD